MNDIEVSSIDLVEGGNVFKQGHYLTLGYVPRDEKGETVDLSGKTLSVSLWGRKGVVFEASATYSGGVIRFTFDKLVAAGDYTVEFTATSSTDAKYRKKFPTNQHSGRIAIKQSADDLGVVGIQVYTVAQLKAELKKEQTAALGAAVGGLTVDSETKMARVSDGVVHGSLPERLEADKQAAAAQLAETEAEAKRKRELEDLAPSVLAAIEGGEGTSFNLLSIPQPGSVTPETTTFMVFSTNLYNSATNKANTNVDGGSGAEVSSTTNSLSDFISIKPSTVYTSSQAHTIAYYTADKTFISRPYNSSGTFTTPANAAFVRLVISNTNVNTTQLNTGSSQLPYTPYSMPKLKKEVIPAITSADIAEGSVTLKKLGFLEGSSNLYNSTTVMPNTNVNSSTGALETSSVNSLSDFIPITPGKVYSSFAVHTVAFYTAAKGFISRPYNSANKFTAPANAAFVRLIISNVNATVAQLNLGETLLPFEAYHVGISKAVLPPALAELATTKPYYFSPEELIAPYKANVENLTGFATPDEYYAAFNSLANAYPDYLTGALQGKDQSGTYDIYKYIAKPQQLAGADSIRKKLPKFVFSIGLHGEEKTSIYAIYYLIKDICENWANDPNLEYLRWNIELEFIPLANPWCFVNGVRHNVNGVDLNRNLPHLWEPLTGNEYSGTGPLSEKESQYIAAMIDANKDALYFGDYHTNGSTSTYEGYDKLVWFSLQNYSSGLYDENVAIAARYTVEKITREYIKDYALPNNVGYFGYLSESIVKGGAKTYAASLGIPACTFETFVKLPTETTFFSEPTIKMGTELMGNWILNLIKQFKTVY